MVNYAEEADFVGRKKPKRYVSAQEAKQRRDARNASRTDDDWRHFARDAVYRQLGVRDRSTHELLSALHARDVPESIALQTVQAFVESGLVNDSTFAVAFVRSRFDAKTVSRRMLAAELKKRGISDDDARAALEQIENDDESRAARDFALRKVRGMAGLSDEVIKRRLYGALGRRGFSPSDCRISIEAALEELRAIEESS